MLTARLQLISVESVIKRRAKYVLLREVPNAYLLDIFDTELDPTRPIQDGKFSDPTRHDPWMDPTRVQLCVHTGPYNNTKNRIGDL